MARVPFVWKSKTEWTKISVESIILATGIQHSNIILNTDHIHSLPPGLQWSPQPQPTNTNRSIQLSRLRCCCWVCSVLDSMYYRQHLLQTEISTGQKLPVELHPTRTTAGSQWLFHSIRRNMLSGWFLHVSVKSSAH